MAGNVVNSTVCYDQIEVLYSILLKLNLYDINNLKYTKENNLVANQYTVFESLRFSHSDYRYSPVKTYANKRTLLEENSGAQWVRICNLLITGLSLYQLSFVFLYMTLEWVLTFINAV